MIQLDVRVRTPRAGLWVGGVVGGGVTPTTYIQLAGAGSIPKSLVRDFAIFNESFLYEFCNLIVEQ